MKIMVDANIIISAILFPKSIISEILKHIVLNNEIILSEYTINEIRDVFNRKFPNRTNEMENYLDKLPYRFFSIKEINIKKYPAIRDLDDIPVLANAIESNVDILVTGDKDFEGIKIKKPKIIKPNKYQEEYML
ncbi:MAG: putative toxin-antitoxin system toxin component, PIN family [Treponema sp.]|nr:putative toxin-antitoxin system toxin component, PIN family [Treponema sp.]